MSSVNEVIIMEKDLDNFPCPTSEELEILLNAFDMFNKYRVLFELMTLTGARIGEATRAKVQEFSEDFSTWKYRIQKPTMTIKYSERTGEHRTVIDVKVRTVQLPSWYAEKLRNYFELNRHSMNCGYIFPSRQHDKPFLTPQASRDMLARKRKSLGLQRIWKVVHKENKKTGKLTKQIWYCIANHSFRRFYITELYSQFLNNGVDNALVLVGKIIGHSRPMKTTSLYLSPRVAHERIPKVYDPEFLEKIQNAKPRQIKAVPHIYARN